MRTPEFPKEIKRGSVSVTIYKSPSKGYVNFMLAYYQDGRRRREYGSDYSAILKRADEVLEDLNHGRPPVEGVWKTAERSEFVRAKSMLKSDLVNLEQTSKIKDERIRQLEESMLTLRQNFEIVSKAMKFNPSSIETEAALKRKNVHN